jgi:hypothetical protein
MGYYFLRSFLRSIQRITAARPMVKTHVKILFGCERSMLFIQSGHSAAKFIMIKILRLEWKGTKKNKKPRPVMIGDFEIELLK